MHASSKALGARRRRMAVALIGLVAASVTPLGRQFGATDAAAGGQKLVLGVTTPGEPWSMAELDRFEAAAGQPATTISYYASWRDEFDSNAARAVVDRGSIPMITWEPWDPAGGVNQPAYRLSTILAGSWDAYILRWAQAAKTAGPMILRFAHEMNGDWYPWSEQVNANAVGQYAAAWRRVRSIFRNAGATNVSWMWSPNVSRPGTTALRGLYPGDSDVDYFGLDGYNGGTALPWGGWQTFDQVFGGTLAEVRAIAQKPILLAEVGSAEAGGNKAQWITDLFAGIARNSDILGVVWFDWNKETDWRIESSPSAQQAFATAVAQQAYPTALKRGAGGYVVEVFGGFHPFSIGGGAPPAYPSGAPYWYPNSVARGATLSANARGGYVLSSYGGVYPFAIGLSLPPPAARGAPAFSSDMARGIALLPNGTGGYVLDATGRLYPFAVGANAVPPATVGNPSWPGADYASGVAIVPDGSGGYVLDRSGALTPFAIGAGAMPAAARGAPNLAPYGYIASGVSLQRGGGGYVLNGYGGLHPFAIGSGPMPPPTSGTPDWSSQPWNIARGVVA